MMFDFKSRVALVTGASRGIGYEIARQFASCGCSLILNAQNAEGLLRVSSDIEKEYGVGVLAVPGDVSEGGTAKDLIAKGLERFQKIDFLINNAGITRDTLLMRMKEEDWDAVMNVNLKSVFLMTKEVVRHMLKSGGGRIINISSIIGQVGGAGQSNYAASKAAVIAFTKSVAQECGSKNVLINAICPGFIETDMTNVLRDERKSLILEHIPQKKMGQAKDVAGAALFLCSELSSYITGQSISVNGGLYMH